MADLRDGGCHVTGVDKFPLANDIELDRFSQADLNDSLPDVELGKPDYVMLDVIEHLLSPEAFVDKLKEAAVKAEDTTFIISTGNVAFLIARIMLLLGQFNYGKRGILDITHTRLFTFGTLRRLFEQAGFEVTEVRGLPAPFPLAVRRQLARARGFGPEPVFDQMLAECFSYQICCTSVATVVKSLLDSAHEQSAHRSGIERRDDVVKIS